MRGGTHSDHIISFDRDLLRLREYSGIPIARPGKFLQRWHESDYP
jgi:predicted nucleic acid-binding protein